MSIFCYCMPSAILFSTPIYFPKTLQDSNRLGGTWKTHTLEINGGETVSLDDQLEHARDVAAYGPLKLWAAVDPVTTGSTTRWFLQCHRGREAADDGLRGPGEKTVGSIVKDPTKCLSVYLYCQSVMEEGDPATGDSTPAAAQNASSSSSLLSSSSSSSSKRTKSEAESAWSSDEEADDEGEEEIWARFRFSVIDKNGRRRFTKARRNYVPFSRSSPKFGFSGFIDLRKLDANPEFLGGGDPRSDDENGCGECKGSCNCGVKLWSALPDLRPFQ